MTVAELIEVLKKLPQDMHVPYEDEDDFTSEVHHATTYNHPDSYGMFVKEQYIAEWRRDFVEKMNKLFADGYVVQRRTMEKDWNDDGELKPFVMLHKEEQVVLLSGAE